MKKWKGATKSKERSKLAFVSHPPASRKRRKDGFRTPKEYRYTVLTSVTDPDPSDPYVSGPTESGSGYLRCMDSVPAPDPDPYIIKQKIVINLDSYRFLTSF